MSTNHHNSWQAALHIELDALTRILATFDYSLDDDQPHIKGERFLMQAVTTAGGSKLILLGRHTPTGTKVIIKATRDAAGAAELRHERTCRSLLHELNFAYDIFHSPPERLFTICQGYTIAVSDFIDQPISFLERPLVEQFDFALAAFDAQASVRATTSRHIKAVQANFGIKRYQDYLEIFTTFQTIVSRALPDATNVHSQLETVKTKLQAGKQRIEQYGDFLTHTDFVPHNFRIKDNVMYLLDFSSLRFGNKHESWARFLNFMTLYNPALEAALIQYVETNRAPEERESLQLMRCYRLGEIICYYTRTLEKSDGNLLALNQTRVDFWSDVLAATLENRTINRTILAAYQSTRDQLRSADEKQRQVGLH